MELNEEQKLAVSKIDSFLKSNERHFLLTGNAGTGKTFLLKHLIDTTTFPKRDIIVCAPTHKAKSVLQENMDREVLTLHKLLGLKANVNIFNLDLSKLEFYSNVKDCLVPAGGLVIVDEGSMINDDLWNLISKRCFYYHSKILVICDPAQLQPVNSKTKSLVFNIKNKFELKTVVRQKSLNVLKCINKFRDEDCDKIDDIEDDDSFIKSLSSKDWIEHAALYYKLFLEKINDVKVLTYTNERVHTLNNILRKLLWANDNPQPFYLNETLITYDSIGEIPISTDCKIVSQPELTTMSIDHYGIQVNLNCYMVRVRTPYTIQTIFIEYNNSEEELNEYAQLINLLHKKALKNYSEWRLYYQVLNEICTMRDLYYNDRVVKRKTIDYGYCTTVHKSQGSTYTSVFVDIVNINTCKDPNVRKQLKYVALSRAKNHIYIYQGNES